MASKNKKKTKKLSRWQKLQNTKLGAQSLEEITDSVRDLANLKIRLPLGNPSLQYVHTNQFLWTDLPKEFRLANFGIISKALNSRDSRWSGYEVNRWYIENIHIRNNGTDFDMELDVNPFASSLRDYHDGKKALEKAFLDNLNKNKSTTKTNKNKVPSVNTSTNIPKRSDGKTDCSSTLSLACNESFDSIGSQVGKVESKLAQGRIGREGTNYANFVKGLTPKEAYRRLAEKWGYTGYNDNRDDCASTSFDRLGGVNCGDSARLLKACMDIVGQPCVIYSVTTPESGHYMNGVLIDGKWETVDLCYQSGRFPELQTAGWNR